jgi:hypothetical protein
MVGVEAAVDTFESLYWPSPPDLSASWPSSLRRTASPSSSSKKEAGNMENFSSDRRAPVGVLHEWTGEEVGVVPV